MPEIDTKDLVVGRRYRIQHRDNMLSQKTGEFLKIVLSPGRIDAHFQESDTITTYWSKEWSFYESEKLYGDVVAQYTSVWW